MFMQVDEFIDGDLVPVDTAVDRDLADLTSFIHEEVCLLQAVTLTVMWFTCAGIM